MAEAFGIAGHELMAARVLQRERTPSKLRKERCAGRTRRPFVPALLPLSAALFAYTAIPSFKGAYYVLFARTALPRPVAPRPCR
jgi:hypothetical protein